PTVAHPASHRTLQHGDHLGLRHVAGVDRVPEQLRELDQRRVAVLVGGRYEVSDEMTVPLDAQAFTGSQQLRRVVPELAHTNVLHAHLRGRPARPVTTRWSECGQLSTERRRVYSPAMPLSDIELRVLGA